MLPIVGVPETIRRGMMPYRQLFSRAEGFEHVSRYVTGLILSSKKTLQGVYDVQVWGERSPVDERGTRRSAKRGGMPGGCYLDIEQ
jgi:hypothetical protein